ncbi:MAG: phosphoribosylglycinamide formyltransferase [Pseudomonadota bacterium]
MISKKRVAILISGRGSNMAALIKAAQNDETYPAHIALVISNRPNAAGLEFANQADIPTAIISHKDFTTRKDFDNALERTLIAHEIDIVCSAGFMRLFTEDFANKWKNRLLNIHPSLLPAFKGLDVHERVLDAGVKISGCTVHFVSAEMDSGPIISQAAVPVLQTDTPETLADRILKTEHIIYPEALRLVASEQVKLEGKCVFTKETEIQIELMNDTETLISPVPRKTSF